MGSYISRNSNKDSEKEPKKPVPTPLLVWIGAGIVIMAIFFHFAQGLIVIIGGIALGLFLRDRFGQSSQDTGENYLSPLQNIIGTQLTNSIQNVWNSVSHLWGGAQLAPSPPKKPPQREGYNNYDFKPKVWSFWESTRN